MFERIVKIGLIGLSSMALSTGAHASPIGPYVKGQGIFYWGASGKKKENAALALGCGYQLNRQKMGEIYYTLPWVMMKGRDADNIRHAITFVVKDLIPLKYYFNLYQQFGFSWHHKLGLNAPFVGCGGTYHWKRKYHVDISWRCYNLLRADAPDSRHHSLTISPAFMVN